MRAFWADLPREGRWVLATTAVQTLGRGLTLPFTIIYLHEVRGIDLDVAGILMAWIALVAFLVTTPAGAATDRFGARAVSLFGAVTNLVGVVVLALATTVPVILVATTLMGVSGVSWPAFNSLIAAIVKGPARQTFFGINFSLVNLGIGVGGLVAGAFVDVHRPGTFIAIYLLDASSMLVPISLLLGPLRHVHGRAERPENDDNPTSYWGIVRQPAFAWLLVLIVVSNVIGYGQMEAGMPAFARQASHVSTRVIGWAFAVNCAIIVLAQFTVLKRISGRRRTRVLVAMGAVWALAWLLIGSTGLLPGGLYAAAGVIGFHLVFGFGETLLQPSIPAMTNDMAPDHLRGRYNALASAGFQSGGVIGPVVAGFLLGHRLTGLYIGLLVAGCVAVALIALGLEQRVSPAVNGVIPG